MEEIRTVSFRRRNLPHWRVIGHSYFVTIRLKNSIPADKLHAIKILSQKIKWDDSEDTLDIYRNQFLKMEKILDSQENHRFLEDPAIAGMIILAFNFIQEKTFWRIVSAVVMPNHIHLLMNGEKANCSLDKCLKTFKGYTGRKANQILNRDGAFWCPEYFDHWCRNAEKEESVKRYIKNNPVKARLVRNVEEWKWFYCSAESIDPRACPE